MHIRPTHAILCRITSSSHVSADEISAEACESGGGLITLIRDNLTFTPTDIPLTINTHNIEFQMVMVHVNSTKHITIANVYIPPRDSTSTHYKTADKDIQHCFAMPSNAVDRRGTSDNDTVREEGA